MPEEPTPDRSSLRIRHRRLSACNRLLQALSSRGGLGDVLLLVEDVREARSGVVHLDLATRLQLAAQVEQDPCDLGTVVELVLDPGEGAALLPERAHVPGAALGVTLGDELDGAELPVLGLGLHGPTVPAASAETIVATTDPAAESYGPTGPTRLAQSLRIGSPWRTVPGSTTLVFSPRSRSALPAGELTKRVAAEPKRAVNFAQPV